MRGPKVPAVTAAQAAYDIWTSSGEIMIRVDTSTLRGSGGADRVDAGAIGGLPFTFYIYGGTGGDVRDHELLAYCDPEVSVRLRERLEGEPDVRRRDGSWASIWLAQRGAPVAQPFCRMLTAQEHDRRRGKFTVR